MRRVLLVLAALIMQPLLVSCTMTPQRGNSAPVDNSSGGYPASVKLQKGPDGYNYVDAQGHFLYTADARGRHLATEGTVARSGGQGGLHGPDSGPGSAAFAAEAAVNCNGTCPADFCSYTCVAEWLPFTAAADAAPVGKWRVMEGPEGPQWAFDGNFVFVPRDGVWKGPIPYSNVGGAFDLPSSVWKKLPYIPPEPKVVAPIGIKPLYVGSVAAYVLTDAKGHALYTPKAGAVCKACNDWVPLGAGAAQQNLGDWTVGRNADRPQWLYRGKPVYVSQASNPIDVPAAGMALQL